MRTRMHFRDILLKQTRAISQEPSTSARRPLLGNDRMQNYAAKMIDIRAFNFPRVPEHC